MCVQRVSNIPFFTAWEYKTMDSSGGSGACKALLGRSTAHVVDKGGTPFISLRLGRGWAGVAPGLGRGWTGVGPGLGRGGAGWTKDDEGHEAGLEATLRSQAPEHWHTLTNVALHIAATHVLQSDTSYVQAILYDGNGQHARQNNSNRANHEQDDHPEPPKDKIHIFGVLRTAKEGVHVSTSISMCRTIAATASVAGGGGLHTHVIAYPFLRALLDLINADLEVSVHFWDYSCPTVH